MLSKNHIKHINTLKLKKNRQESQQFIIEGVKIVKEFLNGEYKILELYGLPHFFETHTDLIHQHGIPCSVITENELKRISFQKTPQEVLGICEIPKKQAPPHPSGLILALDQIQDPGNLGTIIRIADWFGIEHILCSKDCVDCYNPKVIQSTMGSINRVTVHYLDLYEYISNSKLPCFGTFVDGDNIYKSTLPDNAILVMGNESHGIRETLLPLFERKLHIPQFGALQQTESLNVATATAITLSEWRSQSLR